MITIEPMNDQKDQDKNKEAERVGIPVKYVIPEDIVTQYTTDMVVQHSEHEFIISFWEIQRPVILGTEEERKAQAEMLKFLENRCIAKFAVTPDRMQLFAAVMKENFERYLRDKGKPDEKEPTKQ